MTGTLRIAIAAAAAIAVTCGAGGISLAGQAARISASGALVGLASPAKAPGTVQILQAGSAAPVAMAISPDTTVGGICLDCMLLQTFKASDASQKCAMCGCGSPNATCVAWTPLKNTTWQSMLNALPPGTGLRATYLTADKPESGLKSLLIDRRTVLLRVSGLESKSADDLIALVKPFGGTKAALQASGTELVINLKDDWTTQQEAKFEVALAKAGGKIVMAQPDATATAPK